MQVEPLCVLEKATAPHSPTCTSSAARWLSCKVQRWPWRTKRSFWGPSDVEGATEHVSLVADGQRTRVSADNTVITGGAVGAMVQKGANLAADSMRIEHITKHGVVVQGTKSAAQPCSCTLETMPWAEQPVTVERMETKSLSYPAVVAIATSVQTVGVLALDGGCVQLAGVTAERFDCGLIAKRGSDMTVTASKAENCKILGCVVMDATLSASCMVIMQPPSAPVGCAVLGRLGSAKATLTACTVKGGKNHGVLAGGEGATLSCERGIVANSSDSCVSVVGGAHAQIDTTHVSGSKQGSGVISHGQGTVVRVTRCTLEDNYGSGALVGDNVVVTVNRSHTKGNGMGYVSWQGAQLFLKRSDSVGDGSGVVVHGGMVTCHEVDMKETTHGGVLVSSGGTALLFGCSVERSNGKGVAVIDFGSKVHMQGGPWLSQKRVVFCSVGYMHGVPSKRSQYRIAKQACE